MTIDSSVPCTDADPVLARVTRRAGPWFALIWAPFLLIGPVVTALTARDPVRVLSLLVLGATFTVAVLAPFRSWGRPRRRSELLFLAFLIMVTGYIVVWHADQEFLYPLLTICATVALRRRWAMGMVGAIAISGGIAGGIERGSLNAGLFLTFTAYVAGTGTFVIQYLVDVVAQLRRTREQLAEAAVDDERLRFSRDLHDLLGRTLSVIVVKAEAARRLIVADPEAARAHAADIETIGRRALTDVREAVAGYRSVTLGEELASARTALSTAGIELETEVPSHRLPTEVDALLGWVVREGATNVLRHSGAARCRIRITDEPGATHLEIRDDGSGGDAPPGDGLTGLRERVRAVGGELSTDSTPTGFTLSVTVRTGSRAGRR